AYLGQVSEGKGVDDLISLWDEYRARTGRGTLALAGNVHMKMAARDDVVVLGRVSDADKWALLSAADVLVLPSRFESLGIVLLEAWEAGTPVGRSRTRASSPSAWRRTSTSKSSPPRRAITAPGRTPTPRAPSGSTTFPFADSP